MYGERVPASLPTRVYIRGIPPIPRVYIRVSFSYPRVYLRHSPHTHGCTLGTALIPTVVYLGTPPIPTVVYLGMPPIPTGATLGTSLIPTGATLGTSLIPTVVYRHSSHTHGGIPGIALIPALGGYMPPIQP